MLPVMSQRRQTFACMCRVASLAGFTLLTFLALSSLPARADSYTFSPQTKLRIKIVQWIPMKGAYQQWDHVSGDYIVSAEGTITLPLIGSMNVMDVDAAKLAARIGEQIQSKTGLIDAPDTTVEIAEYPPVYIVGSVTTPGAYQFRPGLTVLQALALSGGTRRMQTAEGDEKGQISMLGELQNLRDDILRTLARIGRLQTERTDEKLIRFPAELADSADKDLSDEIIAQEQIVFTARANALSRQLENLEELRSLFTGEIEILGQKTKVLEQNIKLAEDELASVKSLVERGIATVSRRSDLERALAALQSNRLDEITAAMRARQNLSQATRDLIGLRDKHQTDVSTELQEARANLERLRIREDILKKTLSLVGLSVAVDRRNERVMEPALSFTIVRRQQTGAEEIHAIEATALSPGDVVKVSIAEQSQQSVLRSSIVGSAQ